MNKRIYWKDTYVGITMLLIYVFHLREYNPGLIRPFVMFLRIQ